MGKEKYLVKYKHIISEDNEGSTDGDVIGKYTEKTEIVSGKSIELEIEKLRKRERGFKLIDVKKI